MTEPLILTQDEIIDLVDEKLRERHGDQDFDLRSLLRLLRREDQSAEEIAAILDAHQCSPWPRRDKETGTNLSTMRCRECGEVAASPDPLPGARESHKHQASILAANGLGLQA